ncbi:hypothetical protein OIE66_16185 [Nonomuraea sp. NBC_01738]|uniref:hypothetical protein n=1 Tax=Nonomuraea sp. NBC_01738 TaxID=2976003 RepID=UPI002E0DE774|nr:hypothetical protein OIE66_16185 [Nonomuraea sp. NBC_01738]
MAGAVSAAPSAASAVSRSSGSACASTVSASLPHDACASRPERSKTSSSSSVAAATVPAARSANHVGTARRIPTSG